MGKPTAINLNDTTPAAPAGHTNVQWQAGAEYPLPDGQPVRDVSAHIGPASTSAPGLVLYDASGSAYKYLGSDGLWHPVARSKAALAKNFLKSYDETTGEFTQAQPAISDLSGFGAYDGTFLAKDGSFRTPGGGLGGSSSCFVQTNATASRALSTVYQNTAGHPVLIAYAFNFVGAGTGTAYSDSNNPPTTVVSKFINGFAGSTGNGAMAYFFVMPDEYYKITQSSGTIGVWMEYEIVTGTLTRSANLNGSRSLGTVYQNTSGEVMFLTVNWSNTADPRSVTAYVGAANPPTDIVCWQASSTNNGAYALFIPVMQNEYYKVGVDNAANVSVDDWREYTLDTVSIARTGDHVTAVVPDKRGYSASWGYPNISGMVKLVMVSETGNAGTIFFRCGAMAPPQDTQQSQAQVGGRGRHVMGVCLPGYVYNLSVDAGTSPSHWWEWTIG